MAPRAGSGELGAVSLREQEADAPVEHDGARGEKRHGPVPRTGTRLAVWGPVVAWAAVIFGLSSIPSLSTGLETWDLVLRKLAHVVEFAILGALLLRAIAREPAAFALGSAYAATDEVHQAFVPGREGSPVDWLIDVVGVAAGVILLSRRGR
jgi:VanZ family protein